MRTLIALAACVCVATAFSAVPKFTLDLDKPPLTRWDGAVDAILSRHKWEDTFGQVFGYYASGFNALPVTVRAAILDLMKVRYPDNYNEMLGITKQFAKHGHPEMNMTMLSPWLYFYELSHASEMQQYGMHKFFQRACTGILALPKDEKRGTIHGRNLDESPHGARNITLNIAVKKGGKLIYRIFDYSWVVTGTFTAQRQGGVTLEENWRVHGTQSLQDILTRIQSNNSMPISLMFRYVMEQQMDFDAALEFLNTTAFAAPYYVIMSGTNRRGAVLTGSFNPAHNNVAYLHSNASKWYMVQTNYDRWLPDPPSDPRRTVADHALETLGQSHGAQDMGVWMALSTYPVHNPNTLFTVVMTTEKEDVFGFIRDPMIRDPNN